MVKNQEQKIIVKRKELDRLLDWVFKEIKINEDNIKLIKHLLFTKITCMSHEIKLNTRSTNGIVCHYDRKEMREYLKEYVTNKLEKEISS